RRSLVEAIIATTREAGLSSAHVNFHPEDEDAAFGPGWLPRTDLQYHWHNDRGWQDFDEFLAAMDHKHRKNIRQERARVAREGVGFRIVHGDEATPRDLEVIHALYLQTFAEYGNHPALTLGFIGHLAETMPRALVLVLAEHHGEPIAGALCLRGADTLYGRYWGAFGQLPGLHFETCYYQGIEYCLREGLTTFEPGAQGVHKIARGFLPTPVRSRHWIADPTFASALREWCAEESAEIDRHAKVLAQRSPFRAPLLQWYR
ncbi:MAG TPA: GNAT family N-acetyltransferase, partial [Luteimonas sp.]